MERVRFVTLRVHFLTYSFSHHAQTGYRAPPNLVPRSRMSGALPNPPPPIRGTPCSCAESNPGRLTRTHLPD